jgi:hypothetical protein
MTTDRWPRAERDASRARCEAAPRGPWTAEGFSVFHGDDFTLLTAVEDGQGFDGNQAIAALRFIAAARTDLPRAHAEIARLEALLRARGIDPDAGATP